MSTPNEIYNCYLATCKNGVSWSALCDFYYEIYKHTKMSIPEFHIMIAEMVEAHKYGRLWNGYIVTLRPGLIDGQCTQLAKDRKTLPKGGYKFLHMVKKI
jgi:hypothetical protein